MHLHDDHDLHHHDTHHHDTDLHDHDLHDHDTTHRSRHERAAAVGRGRRPAVRAFVAAVAG
jgi:hypothetical protein